MLLHAEDDVLNVLADAAPGDILMVRGGSERVTARDAIPLGHKVARFARPAGAPLRKYGEPIGTLTAAVSPGDHVHVHNVRSGSPAPAVANAQRFEAEAIRRFAVALARDAGATPSAADDLVEAMLEADLRGVDTHGMRRLAPYLERIRSGAVDGTAEPVVTRRASVVDVDAKNAVGHHAMLSACRALAAGAAEHPVQFAAVRESNHFGFAGFYATWLARRGLVAIVASNGTPCVAPPGGRLPFFSNDPLAIAASGGEAMVEYDVALSSISRARIAQAAERGLPIPSHWAIDATGAPTTDATAALAGTLLPFGGERGFGLLFATEVLAGILSGGASADDVASKERPDAVERTSHIVIAISPAATHGGWSFDKRLAELIDRMRAAAPDGPAAPRYPGERRWAHRAQNLAGGVPLDAATVAALTRAGARANVTMLEAIA